MDIIQGAVFINPDGRTVKINSVTSDKVSYEADGGTTGASESKSNVIRMLEVGGYVTVPFATSFFMPKSKKYDGAAVGEKITSGGPEGYWAEIIKRDDKGIHVKFSTHDKQQSTVYLYDEKGFNFRDIFTSEVYAGLSEKFNINVFEVIGVTKDAVDAKFTVIGKSVNQDLLNKINKAYPGVLIYQVKRLTNINIQ